MSKRRERLLFRVTRDGCLAPADGITAGRCRERGYRVGDQLLCDITKPRNPRFNRFAHVFGTMLVENIDDFEGMDPHSVLKRLQWEANVGCEEMGVEVPGMGFATIRIPQSLSFGSMDEGQFREVIRGMSRYIAKKYWPEMTPEEIEQMAETMPEVA